MMVMEVWWRGKLYWKSPPLPYDLDDLEGAIRWVREFHALVAAAGRLARFQDAQRHFMRIASRRRGSPNAQGAAGVAIHFKKALASASRDARALTKVLGARPASVALRLGRSLARRRGDGHYRVVHVQSGVPFMRPVINLPTLDI